MITSTAVRDLSDIWNQQIRPPVSKKSFPVSQMGKKRPVGRSVIFVLPNLCFYKLERAGDKVRIFF